MPTDAEWKILARLFADEAAAFRHQLSLSRNAADNFYAPTEQAATIRAQKQAILDSGAGSQYLFESEDGWATFQEFIPLTGLALTTEDRHALNQTATLALEPDWMLLTPPDWKLVWASVCFPTRWSLAGKGLQPLGSIHAVVPGLNSDLGRKIDVFFARLQPGEGWGRANWGLSTSAEPNQHPSLPYTPLSSRTPARDVYVRLESQQLLKLPASAAVAFGVRIISFPLEAVLGHPEIAAGLKQRLRTMPAEVAAYKGIPQDFSGRL